MKLQGLAVGICFLAACGGGGNSISKNDSPVTDQEPILPQTFVSAYQDLRTCLWSHDQDSPENLPPVKYVPMVRCSTGQHCCISSHRGSQWKDGFVELPDTCLIEGTKFTADSWLAFAYKHESLHYVIDDSCHESPLWQDCVDSNQPKECTPE